MLVAGGDIGLFDERHLPGIFQVHQGRHRGAALRLRLQRQPKKGFKMPLMRLHLRSPGQARKDGLQRNGL